MCFWSFFGTLAVNSVLDFFQQLVNWCFEPSQPLGIIMSGLKETFIKRRIVERTNKAERRPEEQSEKAESCRDNLWNEIQLIGPWTQKLTQEQNKKEWASSVGLCQKYKLQHPHHVKVSRRGQLWSMYLTDYSLSSALVPHSGHMYRLATHE